MKLGGIPYWNKTFRKDLWTLSNAFFTITERILALLFVENYGLS